MRPIGGKQVIGNVDLVKIQGVQILQFIDDFIFAAVSHPVAHHFATDTKYAFERATPAGGDADGQI